MLPSTLVIVSLLNSRLTNDVLRAGDEGQLVTMCPALMVALIKTSEASTSVTAQAPVSPLIISHVSRALL